MEIHVVTNHQRRFEKVFWLCFPEIYTIYFSCHNFCFPVLNRNILHFILTFSCLHIFVYGYLFSISLTVQFSNHHYSESGFDLNADCKSLWVHLQQFCKCFSRSSPNLVVFFLTHKNVANLSNSSEVLQGIMECFDSSFNVALQCVCYGYLSYVIVLFYLILMTKTFP